MDWEFVFVPLREGCGWFSFRRPGDLPAGVVSRRRPRLLANQNNSFPSNASASRTRVSRLCGIAMAYGKSHGGSNFFFDWRGLALGIGLYFIWSFWMQNRSDVGFAVRLFAAYMAARMALLYLLFIAGYRDTLAGVSIPIFDGPALSCIVFSALLAFGYAQSTDNRIQKLLWGGLATAGYAMVLLCFRRTYWGELAVGTVVLLLLQRRHRLRNAAVLAAALCVAAGVLGSSFPAEYRVST